MLALRAITAKLRGREYTTAEAAVVTGMSLTAVNHSIARDLRTLGVAVWGDGKRSISYDGLVALRMAKDYPKLLAPSSRAQVIEKALKQPRKKHLTLERGKVIVRIDTARSAVAAGLRRLYEAEAAVEIDSRTLTGEPCFKGTRIPVYVVAGIAKDVGPDEAKRTYQKLTKSQIELAQVYVKAHPRRGRPKRVGDVLTKRKPKRSRTVLVTID